jgi:hypothetical protein
MGSKAREYKESTLKRLFSLSGNECASPTCNKKLIAHDGITIVSKICHIEAASPDGPRYNSKMSDDDRRYFDNLMLLCDECHTVIDNKANESKYPVALLKEWKKNHEGKMLNRLGTNPSLLIEAINAISELATQDNTDKSFEDQQPFSIEEKISYNSVIRNKFLIEEYKVFYSKINALYDELEKQGNFKKESLLRYIRNLYLTEKGKYIKGRSDIQEAIKENSDNIIEDIQNILSSRIIKEGGIYSEDIEFGLTIIMVDAFMRCKILEEPK